MENTADFEIPTKVNAVFDKREDAERAFDELMYRGYKPDEVNVILSDETHKPYITHTVHENEHANKTMEKAGVGSAVGGTTGAIIGAVAALGTAIIIPPLGIAVAGPLIAAFAGAGAGGLTGGIIGALVGSGMSKEHAEVYETSIKSGGVIISFTPKTIEDRLEIVTAWNNLGAKQLHGNETYSA